jgi:hypothetical protein
MLKKLRFGDSKSRRDRLGLATLGVDSTDLTLKAAATLLLLALTGLLPLPAVLLGPLLVSLKSEDLAEADDMSLSLVLASSSVTTVVLGTTGAADVTKGFLGLGLIL